MKTDMSCLVFGDGSSKHRLKIYNSKLYLQKFNGTSWVGADVVIDLITEMTQTITGTSTVTGQDVDITLTASGASGVDWDHIGISLDGGTVEMLPQGVTTKTFSSVTVGEHKIVASLHDSAHKAISEYTLIEVTVV
jgi:hypothetical protein